VINKSERRPAFEVVLGAAFLVCAVRLGHLLGVSAWLMIVSGAALLVGGGAEITYVRRRMARTCSAEIGTPH
jgi:predicted phage tail protein